MNYTQHARVRMQQRSIPPLIVDWLDGYGSTVKAPGNAEVVFFDHKAKKDLSRDYGKEVVKQLSKYMNTYMVRKECCVVTVGYRNGRLRRQMKFFNGPRQFAG
jgi:hypothetical protein